jgi:hypothetical protein
MRRIGAMTEKEGFCWICEGKRQDLEKQEYLEGRWTQKKWHEKKLTKQRVKWIYGCWVCSDCQKRLEKELEKFR